MTLDVRTSEGATLGTDVILAQDGQFNDDRWHSVKLVKEEDKVIEKRQQKKEMLHHDEQWHKINHVVEIEEEI